MFTCVLSVCLYVSVSSIWANTPALLPPRRPYSASQSPSNSPSACGWLLPFRQGPWFLPVGVRWLSCVMCIREPSSSSFSFAASVAGAVGCNVQERPCCRKASVQIPVYAPPNGSSSLKRGRLERVESQGMITGCAVTRGNSKDPVRREQRTWTRDRKEMEWKGQREARRIEWCEVFWQREWYVQIIRGVEQYGHPRFGMLLMHPKT